jgi:N utilization substance protein A
MEAPELASGAIEVKGLAREPGSRTKIAIASVDPHVDPVGSLVGQRGVRVSTVMSELGGERIDIIEWSEDQTSFIKEALSPATAVSIELDEADHRAKVTVSEDQQSLAIGRGGQNVRLAAKLTGWNIDIASVGGTSVADAAPEESSSTERVMAGSVAIANAEVAIENAEEAVASDPAKEAGIDTGETDSIITVDDAEDNTLPAEEESTKADEDNASIADADDARDEA